MSGSSSAARARGWTALSTNERRPPRGPSLRAGGAASSSTSTCSARAPWAPSVEIFSMSEVRLGPDTSETAEGGRRPGAKVATRASSSVLHHPLGRQQRQVVGARDVDRAAVAGAGLEHQRAALGDPERRHGDPRRRSRGPPARAGRARRRRRAGRAARASASARCPAAASAAGSPSSSISGWSASRAREAPQLRDLRRRPARRRPRRRTARRSPGAARARRSARRRARRPPGGQVPLRGPGGARPGQAAGPAAPARPGAARRAPARSVAR